VGALITVHEPGPDTSEGLDTEAAGDGTDFVHDAGVVIDDNDLRLAGQVELVHGLDAVHLTGVTLEVADGHVSDVAVAGALDGIELEAVAVAVGLTGR